MYYFLSYFNAKLEFIKTIRFFIYEYLVYGQKFDSIKISYKSEKL